MKRKLPHTPLGVLVAFIEKTKSLFYSCIYFSLAALIFTSYNHAYIIPYAYLFIKVLTGIGTTQYFLVFLYEDLVEKGVERTIRLGLEKEWGGCSEGLFGKAEF